MKKFIIAIVFIIIFTICLNGCVPGDGKNDTNNPAGFWWGIWHGIIVWISFIIQLFTGGEYTIYEAFNTGWAYNLGFLLGISSSVGGISIGGVRLGSRKNCDN